MMQFSRRLLAAFGLLTLVTTAWALTSPFKNLSDIARAIGFPAYRSVQGTRTIKIAILDNGFRNHASEIGKTLPLTTTYHVGPNPIDAEKEESHGLFMAQIVSELLATAPGVSYELHLYSAFGYSNLEASINDVIQKQMDIVLYAQVWEYGGFGDGKGFINTLVDKATSAGIVWVNAAGNFANGTYRGKVDRNDDDWATLPGPNNSVRVRCKAKTQKTCSLRAVLSWNDFKDDVSQGTDKDLDLILTDDTLKIVSSSALQQVKQNPPEGASPSLSLYPREIVNKDISPGMYLLRVKVRSKNFDKKVDRLRLTVSGDHIELIDSTLGETVLPPADNTNVISVGANDSERSSVSNLRSKPELTTLSKIILMNGEEYRGSSNASAAAAASLAILKALKPQATRTELLALLSAQPSFPQGELGVGLPLEALEFSATTTRGCFVATALPYVPQPVLKLLRQGATPVATSRGIKIFTYQDPFSLFADGSSDVLRVSDLDMLVVSREGFEALPRSNQDYLNFGSYEIVQIPKDQSICPLSGADEGGSTQPSIGKTLRLPSRQRL